ncbi:DUF438 domain-containing protein [Promethearchaeum syntrophicum]|uniref:DUF438 domain-containing protein n=1 Tax=Promethearchaeum syntrophicum TaxID=2594042 RepID=A0A5B9D871_9ARCH|nr:DUF438 domain-containing protein [Candidatus Prometheoarchaeum syntrophicum]QEE15253.1 Hemerythrin HHE cation binding domain protein [Candidatus Prometheoarchaeum syntrophicum]
MSNEKIFDKRKEILKELVLQLHAGNEDLPKLKKKFKDELGDVSASEIAVMEQELIDSGVLTAEQITKLCDIHVDIFRSSLETHESPQSIPGHPIHTYTAENEKAKELIRKLKADFNPMDLIQLKQINTHYTRLENQLFPMLEKVGFSGPSQVMWAKHDEIRDMFNKADKEKVEELLDSVADMIFKEEGILFPASLEKLTEAQWVEVKNGEEEIGFAWVKPGSEWKPVTPEGIHGKDNPNVLPDSLSNLGLLQMKTGKMSLELVNLMITHLPVDLSFIDENDNVLYYSDVPDRLFPRSPGVIGRNVKNCHPPKSQDIVLRILDAFKKGEKNVAEFWLEIKGQFIYIRYFAVRDKDGKYRGTLEVSQDITNIRKLEGTKRLLNWS